MHFNVDSPVWRFISTVVDFTILNIVFLFTCLPIITVGPAIAGLYSTVHAYEKYDDISLTREYLRRFKREFLPSFLSWLVFLILLGGVVFAVGFYGIAVASSPLSYIVFPIMMLGSVAVAGTFEWFYEIQARFENTLARTFALSASLTWRLLGYTLLLIGIDVAFGALVVFTGGFRVFAIVFGIAWIFYAKSLIFSYVFAKIDRVTKHPEDPNPTNALGL